MSTKSIISYLWSSSYLHPVPHYSSLSACPLMHENTILAIIDRAN
ncbi:hypothetical protein SAMN00120144_3803 [Hymenobacter roseosalivarius DSM 11622]|uniref:Uncharacterized protein n=1 Tax=Hymenobacter roseosalivarius DSM 11622 TaxID=645990 RepID=A0A1W1UHN7_9BACT|nr:hypothetical protein SAMN00120144_3803 [Hymenobacter roseosalivarius DSM 11622]